MARDPTIPTIVPNLGTPRMRAYTPEINMGPANRYYGNMQETGAKIIDLIGAIKLQYDQAEAKRAFNEFDVKLNEYVNKNFYTKKNKDLVDAYQPTLNGLYGEAKAVADELSGDVRELFIRSANERMRQVAMDMNAKFMSGVMAWQNTESEARLNNLMNDAAQGVQDWQNPNGTFQISLQSARNEIAETLVRNGVPEDSEEFKKSFRGTMSTFHSGSLDNFLASEMVQEGWQYLKLYREEMNERDAATYENKLKLLQEQIAKRAMAERAAQEAAAKHAQNMSYEDMWEAKLQQAYDQIAKIRNDATLDDQQKRIKIQGINEELMVFGTQLNEARKQSQLNDANIKRQTLSTYQGRILNYLYPDGVTGERKESVPLEKLFSPSELATMDELGIRENLSGFMQNGGVIVPSSADYATYDQMLERPSQYINLPSAVLEGMMTNFTDPMKKAVRKAIEGEVRGDLDPAKAMIDRATADISDKAEKGQFRQFVNQRAQQILAMSGVKTITAKERQGAVAQAIVEAQSMQTEGRFFGPNSATTKFVNAMLIPGNSTAGITFHNTYTDPQGNTRTIDIPVDWLYSDEGNRAYQRALAQVNSGDDINRRNPMYIYALVDAIYDEQQAEKNGQKLGVEQNETAPASNVNPLYGFDPMTWNYMTNE